MSEASETPAPERSASRVSAEHLDNHGDGVGSLQGETLPGVRAHVRGLLPGEVGRVQVTRHLKRAKPPRALARLLTREQVHPQRRQAPCRHQVDREDPHAQCAGCPLMVLPISEQIAIKRARVEAVLGLQLDAFVAAADPWGYRMSSKRVVGGRRGELFLGSYTRGSHRVADMADCRVDHPRIVEAYAGLVALANQLGIEAFREARPASKLPGRRGRARPASGDLRYVWAKSDGAKVVLTLITGSEQSRAAEELAPRLLELPVCQGVAWSVQSADSNAVRGDAARPVAGDVELRTTWLGQDLVVGALGFLQPNPTVAGLAYNALVSQPGPEGDEPAQGDLAYDLYAGAGVTTCLLREQFAEVIPCELYPESAEALGVPPSSSEDFLRARLADTGAPRPQLIVANPPRKGMGRDVCAALVSTGAARLHIMSCSPDSLARDLASLASHYVVEAVRAFDTLPHTAHVECVAWLRKREA